MFMCVTLFHCMDIVLKPFVGGFVFKSVVTDRDAVEMIQRYWFTIF